MYVLLKCEISLSWIFNVIIYLKASELTQVDKIILRLLILIISYFESINCTVTMIPLGLLEGNENGHECLECCIAAAAALLLLLLLLLLFLLTRVCACMCVCVCVCV